LANILAEHDIPRFFPALEAATEYDDRFRDAVETHRLDAASRETSYCEQQKILI
jgi:hypothetical protein